MTAPEIGVACSRCDDPLVIRRDGVRDPDRPARFMHRAHSADRLDLAYAHAHGDHVQYVAACYGCLMRATVR